MVVIASNFFGQYLYKWLITVELKFCCSKTQRDIVLLKGTGHMFLLVDLSMLDFGNGVQDNLSILYKLVDHNKTSVASR